MPRGALSVVDEVIVTARTEPMAARSLGRLFTVLDLVRKHENPNLAVTGVLPTFYDERNAISQSLLTAMRTAGVPLFAACIPHSELFIRASERGQPLRRFVRRQVRGRKSQHRQRRLTHRVASQAESSPTRP